MIRNILVVCIGNICRSPMAVAMLQAGLPECTISSAGLGALVGRPADPHAVTLMRERALDISAHRARQLEGWMVQAADLVLVMDAEQKRRIESNFPFAQGKVFRLGEPEQSDIADPYQQDIAVFRKTADLVARSVAAWVNRIRAIA